MNKQHHEHVRLADSIGRMTFTAERHAEFMKRINGCILRWENKKKGTDGTLDEPVWFHHGNERTTEFRTFSNNK